jgi:glucokinase
MSAIVIDLGGSCLRCGVANESGSLVPPISQSNLSGFKPSEKVWKEIVGSIIAFERQLGTTLSHNAPIVFSFPGPVVDSYKLTSAPTVAGPSEIPDLRAILDSRTGRRSYFLNDISAAAWYLSRKVDVDRFLVITVSSGIGAKVFDRQHPRRVLDDVPYAGELGHMVVDDSADAPPCDCGGRGHLGAIASGRGIERAARSRVLRDERGFGDSLCCSRFHATAGKLTNEVHLVPAAQLGDHWALSVIRDCTRPLAKVIVNTVVASGIQKDLIIGGFALTLGSIYIEMLQELISQNCDYAVLKPYLPNLVMLGNPGENACLAGAAIYSTFLR